MFFDISLYLALILFTAGLMYRLSRWFLISFDGDISPGPKRMTAVERFFTVLRRSIRVMVSTQLFHFIYSAVVDGFFQVRILKTSFIRWLMHALLFLGFVMLVLMHVFDETITASIFSDYAPTLNPFMMLRNVFGLCVLTGLFIAIARRVALRKRNVLSNGSDMFLILVIGVIIVSGFFLEAAKIVSEAVYDDMIIEYSDLGDESQEEALKAYWASEFHVEFASLPEVIDDELLALGEEVHEENCASCHSRPQSAFVSFSLVTFLNPLAAFSNRHRLDTVFLYIHYLAALIALALLPFTKAFHLISTPVSMALNRVFKGRMEHPATVSVKRMIELDACIHCGACSAVCSVGPMHTIQKQETILPSEKLRSIVHMVARGGQTETCENLLDGSIVCTDCYRCNEVCPAGIDLRGLWIAAKAELERKGHAQPHVQIKSKTMHDWAGTLTDKKNPQSAGRNPATDIRKIIDNPEFFSGCVQCTTCANVCPVVAYTDGSTHDAGMTPQQVMNFLRLEMKEDAYIAGLTWSCATCYLCQEHCPQGIPVTEILNELRCQGFKRLRTYQRHAKNQDER